MYGKTYPGYSVDKLYLRQFLLLLLSGLAFTISCDREVTYKVGKHKGLGYFHLFPQRKLY